MHALFEKLKFRILASLVLAVAGNSSAASNIERNVLNFKPVSPSMRPQTQTKKTVKQPATIVNPDDVGLTQTMQIGTTPVTAPFISAPSPVTNAPSVNAPSINAPSAFQQPAVTLPTSRPSSLPPIAEPDNQTTGAIATGVPTDKCPTGNCLKSPATGSLSAQADNIKDVNDALSKSTGNSALKDKLAIAAVRDAMKGRSVAHMCGGGFRSGNRSKCMCAAGVKEALRDSGACGQYLSGDAVQIAGLPHGTTRQLASTGPVPSRGLASVCPAFHQTRGRMAKYTDSLRAALAAPAGSVIVYSTSRHSYGHIETKIQVTSENIGAISKNLKVKVGQFLYCSDFCRTGPTFSHETNRVEAIYSL